MPAMNEIVDWRVIKWSRELGRGRIGSPRSGSLEFDASVATVDDFKIGEEVRIDVTWSDNAWKVTRIAPAIGRFTPPCALSPIPVELQSGISTTVQDVISQIHLQEIYEVTSWTPMLLVLSGYDPDPYPPPGDALEFEAPIYVELPIKVWPQSIRLSDATERAYLAAKVEDFSAESVAISIVDAGCRYYFVVCSGLRYRAPDRAS